MSIRRQGNVVVGIVVACGVLAFITGCAVSFGAPTVMAVAATAADGLAQQDRDLLIRLATACLTVLCSAIVALCGVIGFLGIRYLDSNAKMNTALTANTDVIREFKDTIHKCEGRR